MSIKLPNLTGHNSSNHSIVKSSPTATQHSKIFSPIPILSLINSGKKLFSYWRIVVSALLFVAGILALAWGGLHLLTVSQVPECVYLVDEQRQLLEEELKLIKELASTTSDEDDLLLNQLWPSLVSSRNPATIQESANLNQMSVFSAESLGKIIVQIAGAVQNPGVYQLSSRQRIGDLIALAGGLVDKADQQALLKQYNLASKLKDEQRIYIPFKQEQELEVWLAQYCKTTNSGSGSSVTTSGSNTQSTTPASSTATKTTPTSGEAMNTQDSSLSIFLSPVPVGDDNYEQDEPPANSGCISINQATSEQLQTLSGVGPATATLIIDGRPYLNISDLLSVKGIGQATLEKLEPFICL